MASSDPFDGTNFLTTVPSDGEPHGNDYQEHQATKKSMEFVNNKEHTAIGVNPSVANAGGEHKNGSSVAYFTSTAPTLRPDGLTALADNDVDKGRMWIDTSDDVIRQKTWNGSAWVLVSNEIVGSITEYAGSSAPTGYLLCDGSTGLSTVANPEYVQLFAVIGIVYGGTSTTDFALPDKRGRVAMGVGTGDASDATAHTLGQKQGTETHELIEAELASHKHTFSRRGEESGQTSTSRFQSGGSTLESGTFDMGMNTNGSGTAHNNLQPSLGLNFIIKI